MTEFTPSPSAAPDYLAHDDVYQKLRSRGANGWGKERLDDAKCNVVVRVDDFVQLFCT